VHTNQSIKKGVCKISCFSIFDLSSHPIFGYNVKDVSVIYKKIHGSINYRLWHASCHTTTIHTWFCDFIRPKYRIAVMWQYACHNLYFGQKKKYWLQVRRILDFYHKLFPWAGMIPLSPHCCCCIHVYCDIHLWWLYNTLENYKLHHPSNASNDNTRTMQKQLSNKFQAGTAKSAFFCAHTKCKL